MDARMRDPIRKAPIVKIVILLLTKTMANIQKSKPRIVI
jgi:hypothetical protein